VECDAATEDDAVPGSGIELMVLDDGTATTGEHDPGQAMANARKMVPDRDVVGALGPEMSGAGKAMAPFLSKAGWRRSRRPPRTPPSPTRNSPRSAVRAVSRSTSALSPLTLNRSPTSASRNLSLPVGRSSPQSPRPTSRPPSPSRARPSQSSPSPPAIASHFAIASFSVAEMNSRCRMRCSLSTWYRRPVRRIVNRTVSTVIV
jgi:hypothetical protein